METISSSIVDLSRAQFALTALYHFLFVPLTLGLSFIVAFMETLYLRTRDEKWLIITKFWMKIFGINFAIGVATGIIMEFEFGTNWANYSYFVGDIFGAPLAIEGLFAFFLEATFFAVMFFGWNKVSPKFHLISTYMVAIGSNLSAFWILVANAWMQYPSGTTFNMQSVRNEMTNFFDVAFSPVALSKFNHTVFAGYLTAAMFVLAISAYYLYQNRYVLFAKRSFVIASTFGLVFSLVMLYSGDDSAYKVAKYQPMKLAAMEGIYEGTDKTGIIAFGILNPKKSVDNNEQEFLFDIKIPYMLSILATRSFDGYVPGIKDLIYGNKNHNITSIEDRIQSGKKAVSALNVYRMALKEDKNLNLATAPANVKEAVEVFRENMKNLGYGYLKNALEAIPPVKTTFYAFHLMVMIGLALIALFGISLFLVLKRDICQYKKFLKLLIWCWPLGFIGCEAGWIVAEVGRQPWAIQDLMPVGIAATDINASNISLSIIAFAVVFTALLIAEVKIILNAIRDGFVVETKGGQNV